MKKILIIVGIIVIIGAGYFAWRMKYSETGERAPFKPSSSSIAKLSEEVNKYLSTGGADVLPRVSGEPQDWTLAAIPAKDIANMKTTSLLGISFKTPLGTGTETESTKKYEGVRETTFANGTKILVTSNLSKMIDEIRQMTEASSTDVFVPVLGEKVNSSYDLLYFILHSTPNSVSQSKTMDEARAHAQALVIKDISSFGKLSKTYQFSRTGVKGFVTEFNDQDGGAVIELFFDNGKWYSALLSVLDEQAINAIIQTAKVQ